MTISDTLTVTFDGSLDDEEINARIDILYYLLTANVKEKIETESEWRIVDMTRFSAFSDEELDAMESAFCNEGLGFLVEEIRRERR